MALDSYDLIIEPDLKILNGDLSIEKSDDRNIQYITYSQSGQIRRQPTLGVGINDFINSSTDDGRNIRKRIRQELEKDGYTLTELSSEEIEEGLFDIDVKAIKNTVNL